MLPGSEVGGVLFVVQEQGSWKGAQWKPIKTNKDVENCDAAGPSLSQRCQNPSRGMAEQ